jgi:hypothetical protein
MRSSKRSVLLCEKHRGKEFKHQSRCISFRVYVWCSVPPLASPDAAPTAKYPLPVLPVGSRGSVAREMEFVPSSWMILQGRREEVRVVRCMGEQSGVQRRMKRGV